MTLTRSLAVRNAELDAGSGGTTFNRLSLFSGAPVGASAAQTGTELVRFTLNATPFPAASAAALITNAIADSAALAGGTVASFVFWNTSGTALTSAASASDRRLGGSVTGTGGGGDFTMDNTTVALGQSVHANALTINAPA